MKQVLITILVLCHLGACLWSCYKPGSADRSKSDLLSFTGASIHQDKKQHTHVNWETSGKLATVRVYGSPQKEVFSTNQFLGATDSKYLKIPSDQLKDIHFLHLIIAHQDTLVMALDQRQLGLLKPKKSRK